MRNRYRGRHRKQPYGATIGQVTVDELKYREIWEGYSTEQINWRQYSYPLRTVLGEEAA